MVIRDLFLIFIAVWSILAIFAIIKYTRIYRSKVGRVFPPKDPKEVLYEEYSVSGRSMKSLYTRLGGANNCLRLVVGVEKFWVTVMSPFNLIGNQFDLEHEISYKDITELQWEGKLVKIAYKGDGDGISELELKPDSVPEFYGYLKELTSSQALDSIGTSYADPDRVS